MKNDLLKNGASPGDKTAEIIIAEDIFPEVLPILPMINRPVFPGMMLPMIITGEELVNTIKTVYESETRLFGAVLVKKLNEENLLDSALYEFGTAMKLHKIAPGSDDAVQILVQGLKRFKLNAAVPKKDVISWEV